MEKVTLRLWFVYEYEKGGTPGTNTYKVFVDNKLVIDVVHIDDTGGHKPLDKRVKVGKGRHEVRVEYLENKSSAKIEDDFQEDTGLEVSSYYDRDSGLKKLRLERFDFGKVFVID